VLVEHALAHRQHFFAQRGEIARLAQDLDADRLELLADGRVAGAEAGARQRLVFPDPGVLQLIVAKSFDRTDEHARIAVRAQAQVDLEEHAGRRLGRHPGAHALAETGIEFAGIGLRIVVQIDQVEVGSETEFLAAELAVGDDREARRTLGMGMALLQLVPAQIHRRLHHDVGEFAEAVGEVLDGVHAGDVLRQEVKTCAWWVSRRMSISRSMSSTCRARRAVQILAETLPVGADIKDARIEQFVEQNRVPGQVVGRPRRAADQFGELHQRLRILLQQRQIGAAPADRIEEIEAALPGRVGCRWPPRRRSGAARGRRGARGCSPATAGSGRSGGSSADVRASPAAGGKPSVDKRSSESSPATGSSQIPASGCRPSSGSEKTCSKWRATVARCASRTSEKPMPVGEAHRSGNLPALFVSRPAGDVSARRRRTAAGVRGGAGTRRRLLSSRSLSAGSRRRSASRARTCSVGRICSMPARGRRESTGRPGR
jgi:hypothetical protein